MPAFRIPKLSHHKASGQAVVRLGGRDFYLGQWQSKTARNEYDRLVAEWLIGGRTASQTSGNSLNVNQILAVFWDHAESYYRLPDGTPGKEISSFRDALRPLRRLYGHTAAEAFGPLALKAVRQAMIDAGLCRTNINHRIGRIKRVFKWAVENELVAPSVFHGLQAVAGLKAGRCEARESEPVKPAPIDLVEAVLPFVATQVRAMAELQLLTGMRPGEVVLIRGVDIDMSQKLWAYRPAKHKTAYLGQDRLIFFGPKAQDIIRPFLKPDLTAYLFSPVDADIERRARLHLLRKTPMSCGNTPGSNVALKPKRKPTNRYTVESYARAIKYGCERAFPLPASIGLRLMQNGKRETKKAWLARLTPTEKMQIKAWRKAHSWHPHQLRQWQTFAAYRHLGSEQFQFRYLDCEVCSQGGRAGKIDFVEQGFSMPQRVQIDADVFSPFRTPDWRWISAQACDAQCRRRSNWDDVKVSDAIRYLRVLRSEGASEAANRWPSLSAALLIYHTAGMQREELEARLLSGEPFDVISAKTDIAIETVIAFEAMFFNVVDALNATDWIMTQVIKIFPGKPVTEGQTWKYLALAGGPMILDLMIDDFLGRPDPGFTERRDLAAKGRYIVREFATGLQLDSASAAIIEEGCKLFPNLGRRHRGSKQDQILAAELQFLRSAVGLQELPEHSEPLPRSRKASKDKRHGRQQIKDRSPCFT